MLDMPGHGCDWWGVMEGNDLRQRGGQVPPETAGTELDGVEMNTNHCTAVHNGK